jgi:sialate O-acetylesterase
MKKFLKFICILIILFLFISHAFADVRLPKILSSNMVLQRDTEFRIWGWADKGEKVTVVFNNVTRSVKTSADDRWIVTFPAMKAGGPYKMVITGKNKIELINILMGDVWVCSGQSNMEWPLSQANNAEEEIAAANYPDIRLFHAPRNIQFKPADDVQSGEWKVCSPETVSNFSAVGYFFGRFLYKEIDVPVGLLFTSWGGTNVETWTSEESANEVKELADKLIRMKNFDPDKELARRKVKMDSIINVFGTDESGMVNGKAVWADADLDDSRWMEMKLPTLWEDAGIDGLDGFVWFRKEVQLPKKVASEGITLHLGQIDDSDITWINGIKVGEMQNKYNENRIYRVSPDIFKPGRNVITVRVEDTGGGGGIWGMAEEMKVIADDLEIPLAGIWKFRISSSEINVDYTSSLGPNSFPTLLFNGMIHPFLNYSVKGAIWYQGEANASRAYQYRTLFPLMIRDWRKQWNNPDMPFFFVQLANYMQPPVEPGESEWAELREAQLMTLQLPKTGMAVTIDIGEANDIHPRNKQDVGKRLALAALKIAYDKDIVYSGPLFNRMTVSGNKAILEFNNTGGGLTVNDRYGYVKGFAIAGADRKFYWAKAYIEHNSIVVSCDKVTVPVAVRYGWADNPDDVNVYNAEGLPASPFRTDEWPGITVDKK